MNDLQPQVGDTFLRNNLDGPGRRLINLLTGRARMWQVLCDNGRGTVGCDFRPLTWREKLEELGRIILWEDGKDFFE